jgi:hypothetical protein
VEVVELTIHPAVLAALAVAVDVVAKHLGMEQQDKEIPVARGLSQHRITWRVEVVVQGLLVGQQLALHKHSQIQWRIELVLAA